MANQQIELNNIIFNRDFQAREKMSSETLEDYMDAMKNGADFPAVVVFQDGSQYYLADGYHRVAAAMKLERKTINAEVHVGTRRAAMLYALGANANHGLRRTRADKRRAVEMMLRDNEWCKWSDRQIARKANVDHKTVGSIRKELEAAGEIPQITKRTRSDGQIVDTTNIGTSPAPVQTKQWAEMNNGVRRLNKEWIEANFDTSADWHVLHKRIDEQVNPNGFTFIHTDYGFLYIGKEKVIRSAVETCGLMDSGEWYYTHNHHGSCWLIASILLFEQVSKKLYNAIYYPALHYSLNGFANQYVLFNSKKKSALRSLPPQEKTVVETINALDVARSEPLEQSVLPQRQIEFLQALKLGEPVVKNAATRMALRERGYITDTDDWNAIQITAAGKVALLNLKMPPGVTVQHIGTYSASDMDRMHSDLTAAMKPQPVETNAFKRGDKVLLPDGRQGEVKLTLNSLCFVKYETKNGWMQKQFNADELSPLPTKEQPVPRPKLPASDDDQLTQPAARETQTFDHEAYKERGDAWRGARNAFEEVRVLDMSRFQKQLSRGHAQTAREKINNLMAHLRYIETTLD